MVTIGFIKKRTTDNDSTKVLLGMTNPWFELCFDCLMSIDMARRNIHPVYVRPFIFSVGLTPINFQHLVSRIKVNSLNRARRGFTFGVAYHSGQFAHSAILAFLATLADLAFSGIKAVWDFWPFRPFWKFWSFLPFWPFRSFWPFEKR